MTTVLPSPRLTDALSEVLALCKCERAVTARFSLHGDWGLRSDGVSGALIRMAQGEPYWVRVLGEKPVLIAPGDLVMFPFGAAHSIYSAEGVIETPFKELIPFFRPEREEDAPLVLSIGEQKSGKPSTEIFSLHMWLSAHLRNSAMSALPEFIHIKRESSSVSPVIADAVAQLVAETFLKRPGWQLAAARISDLVLIHVLRAHLSDESEQGSGWLRALTDPAIAKSIVAIHRTPEADWTVEALAGEAALSRSRFCARFTTLVGETPMNYLASHRMSLAAALLEGEEITVARLAERVGYQSDKVFARAFRRRYGSSPKAWVKARSLAKTG